MTTTTYDRTLDGFGTRQELRDHLRFDLRPAGAARGTTQSQLLLLHDAHETLLGVAASYGRLRAQDRRRLHRLGLREAAPGTWLAHVPRPRPPRSDGVVARLAARRAFDAARGDLVLHVLRDALQVDVESVVLVLEPDELLEDDEAPEDDDLPEDDR